MIYIDNTPVNTTRFPDNTTQVWKLPEEILKRQEVEVRWKFSHEGEIMELAQLKTLLDHYLIKAELSIQFLPYGRQDKPVSNDATFALRSFAKILNCMEFARIYIQDPHSRVALTAIHNSSAYYATFELLATIRKTASTIILYPDKGAIDKYVDIYRPSCKIITATKTRNQDTGHIEYSEIHGNYKDQTVLIVDDICDGGMTFKLLARKLMGGGAKEVNLFVTHGIFSKGLRTITDSGIKGVYTPQGKVIKIDDTIHYQELGDFK